MFISVFPYNFSFTVHPSCHEFKKIEFFLFQASQIDVECVRVTSLKVMIDLLHMHGTEAIKHAGKKPTEEQLNTSCDLYEEPTDNSEQASKLVAFLTAFLDSQVFY